MTCDPWQQKLGAYVDGDASQEDLASLGEHLRTCPSCAADALGRLQMKRMTQAAAARYSPSPQFRLRIEKAIHKSRKPLWAFAWMPTLAAFAVALVLIIASAALWMRHSAREQTLAELLDLHVATMASANPGRCDFDGSSHGEAVVFRASFHSLSIFLTRRILRSSW